MTPEKAQAWRRELRLVRAITLLAYLVLLFALSLMYGGYAALIVLFASGFLIVSMVCHSLLWEARQPRPK